MATDANLVPHVATDTSDGALQTGTKIRTGQVKGSTGAVRRVVERFFGGPTATNGANTTSELGHAAVAETYDDSWDVGNVTVTTSAGRVDNVKGQGASAGVISYRKKVTIRSKLSNTQTVYLGPNSSVTASSTNIGAELLPGMILEFKFGESLAIYAITGSSTAVLEVYQEA